MVGNDYLVVIEDLLKDVKKRPIITTIKLLPLSGAFYAYKTNPTEKYVHLLKVFRIFIRISLMILCRRRSF